MHVGHWLEASGGNSRESPQGASCTVAPWGLCARGRAGSRGHSGGLRGAVTDVVITQSIAPATHCTEMAAPPGTYGKVRAMAS